MSNSNGPNIEDDDDIVILNSDDEDVEAIEDLEGQREECSDDEAEGGARAANHDEGDDGEESFNVIHHL